MRESSYRARRPPTTAVINSDLMKAKGARKKILARRDYREWNPGLAIPRRGQNASTRSNRGIRTLHLLARIRGNVVIAASSRKNGEKGKSVRARERRRKLAAMQITAASAAELHLSRIARTSFFSRDRRGQTCISQDRVLRAGISSMSSV